MRGIFGEDLLAECLNGRLMIYSSSLVHQKHRLNSVTEAAEKIARQLDVDVELKTFRKRFKQIYVYYGNGDGDPIPIYCSNNAETDSGKVYSALRNMMFVLSFHPRHSALKAVRKEIMLFS